MVRGTKKVAGISNQKIVTGGKPISGTWY